jgi:hypothetical protein
MILFHFTQSNAVSGVTGYRLDERDSIPSSGKISLFAKKSIPVQRHLFNPCLTWELQIVFEKKQRHFRIMTGQNGERCEYYCGACWSLMFASLSHHNYYCCHWYTIDVSSTDQEQCWERTEILATVIGDLLYPFASLKKNNCLRLEGTSSQRDLHERSSAPFDRRAAIDWYIVYCTY